MRSSREILFFDELKIIKSISCIIQLFCAFWPVKYFTSQNTVMFIRSFELHAHDWLKSGFFHYYQPFYKKIQLSEWQSLPTKREQVSKVKINFLGYCYFYLTLYKFFLNIYYQPILSNLIKHCRTRLSRKDQCCQWFEDFSPISL